MGVAEPQTRHRERRILDAADLARCLTRLAHEVVERNRDVDQVVFVGIRTRGVPLARRLQQAVREITGTEPPLGILDISLYRDDLSRVASSPVVGRTEIDFALEDRVVVLVDDVLYTGRTTRAALDALMEFGRPRRIQLAVVIDRGPPRVSDPRRLRGQERAHQQRGDRARPAQRHRPRRRSGDRAPR